MVIKYLKDGSLVVDKSVSLNNSFALAKYDSANENVMFKANVVIEKHTMLITLMQVTKFGKRSINNYQSDSTLRRVWLERNFRIFEQAVKKHLSARNYKGSVEIRLKLTDSSASMFTNLGYKYTGEKQSVFNGWCGYTYIYSKTI